MKILNGEFLVYKDNMQKRQEERLSERARPTRRSGLRKPLGYSRWTMRLIA